MILSDKKRFPAFMRTIPNDEHQTAAMVRLLSHHDWNWVGIVITDGDYGRSALENFVSHASEQGICIAFRSILPQSVTGLAVQSAVKQTAETIAKNPKVQVIVSFAKPAHMMYVYRELSNQVLKAGPNESMWRVWVASDSWSSSGSVQGNLTLDTIGQVLGFTFKSGDISSFNEYLNRLEAAGLDSTGNNFFLQELYRHINNSEGSSDADELRSKAVKILRGETHADMAFSIELAVSAIAQAVASVCRDRDCKTPGSLEPWEVRITLRD